MMTYIFFIQQKFWFMKTETSHMPMTHEMFPFQRFLIFFVRLLNDNLINLDI